MVTLELDEAHEKVLQVVEDMDDGDNIARVLSVATGYKAVVIDEGVDRVRIQWHTPDGYCPDCSQEFVDPIEQTSIADHGHCVNCHKSWQSELVPGHNNLFGWHLNGEKHTQTFVIELWKNDAVEYLRWEDENAVLLEVEGQMVHCFDNGGELMLSSYDWEHPRAIPTTSEKQHLTPQTIVYRLLAAVSGQAIDYNKIVDGPFMMVSGAKDSQFEKDNGRDTLP